jgi:hypothetical protein
MLKNMKNKKASLEKEFLFTQKERRINAESLKIVNQIIGLIESGIFSNDPKVSQLMKQI